MPKVRRASLSFRNTGPLEPFNRSRISTSDLIDSTGNETTTDPTELNTPAVQVFPNATTGSLNISFKTCAQQLACGDDFGRLKWNVVKEITDSTYDNIPTEMHVDVSAYKKGIYILQINIDGATSQQRVVVE